MTSSLQPSLPGVREYFEHVVTKYNCGDVQALIDARLSVCGPLLATTVNGIDLVGGMIEGFSNNSQSRSVNFAERFLGLTTEQARALYVLFRCGLSHEGVSKQETVFFLDYDARPKNFMYSVEPEKILALDVTQLARQYLAAVQAIATDPSKYVSFVPPSKPKDQQSLMVVRAHGTISFDDFCKVYPLRAMSNGSGSPNMQTWIYSRGK